MHKYAIIYNLLCLVYGSKKFKFYDMIKFFFLQIQILIYLGWQKKGQIQIQIYWIWHNIGNTNTKEMGWQKRLITNTKEMGWQKRLIANTNIWTGILHSKEPPRNHSRT